ncbi:MAG: DNA-processing protein DprA [Patescibacteria group bacterium]|nr:DNA-processing protein DprA [Patescibacteria group bacterium]
MSRYLLVLNAHEKIGSQTLKKALAPFEDNPEKLWKAGESEIRKKLDSKIAELIIEAKNQFTTEEEIEKLQKFNIGYITMYDKSYPKLLAEAPDGPAILYIKGNLSALKKPSIGVVGSRKFSHYGQKIAYQLSKSCSEAGLGIVSGLALGIDAVAHKAALDVGGITIGVLGCGLDRIYPASNLALGREIIEKNGAVISEFPPGTPPMKYNFPARNRIIAGLTLGTLVVEAAEQSGALITAYQALEYNREVFAVPGNIDSETSKGTNLLIQKGAKLVTKPEDILEEFNIEAKNIEQKNREFLPENENEKIILNILSSEERLVDDIIAESKLNIITVNTVLTLMEMKGIVDNIGGGRYKLR